MLQLVHHVQNGQHHSREDHHPAENDLDDARGGSVPKPAPDRAAAASASLEKAAKPPRVVAVGPLEQVHPPSFTLAHLFLAGFSMIPLLD